MEINCFHKHETRYAQLVILSVLLVMALIACGGGHNNATESAAPSIVSVSPAAGATDVALNSQVQATFSTNMDSSTINTDTFTIVSPSGDKVIGTVSYDDTTNTATFIPSSSFAPQTTYTATIAGVKDKAGNTMNTPYSWSFTTITGFWAFNFVNDSYYLVSAIKAGEGNHCIVYIEQGQSVDPAVINSIMNQFDNTIYPDETSTFGSEPNPGIDGNSKIFILLLDIEDGYSSNPYLGYVAGYFDPMNEDDTSVSPYSNQKEIFFMDINPGVPGDSTFIRTLAHEFQHMISWNEKTNILGVLEDTWLDEAMSEIAPVVCGYGPDYEEVYSYELIPWDSLIGWDSQSYDYATAYMWAQYMKDRVTNTDASGHGVFWNIDHTSSVGINAVNSALSTVGYGKDFTDVFRDWSIANYLGLTSITGHPEWSFTSIHTEAGYATEIGPLPGLPFNDSDHINAATVGGLHMWGLDYFKFTKAGDGTVTWTRTAPTDEAAFINTNNNTVTFNMTSGNVYPYTDEGILISRNPTSTEKWTLNGGGTITFTSLATGKNIINPYFSKKSSTYKGIKQDSLSGSTAGDLLSRLADDPIAKDISARTGRPFPICVYSFFKEKEKILRLKLKK
jgi:hypothetical protein